MLKHNQDGAINSLVISDVLLILLLIGALAFGVWAYGGRQDYKNNVDAKINTAVTAAKQKQNQADQAQFAEEAKQPLKAYNGPQAYGSLVVNFPKNWSAYVDDTGNSPLGLVDGYFAPGTVPSISDSDSVFALRVQIINKSYTDVVGGFSRQLKIGKLTASAYALPKFPKNVGIEVNGLLSLQDTKTVTMVVVPFRSQTLEIWTQGTQYLADFNNNILPNFSFSP
jgi:hypothetical protein